MKNLTKLTNKITTSYTFVVLSLFLLIGSTDAWGWYVAGSPELVNSGNSWSLGDAEDEMTNISGNWYVLSVPNKTHAANTTYYFRAYETTNWSGTQIPSSSDMWYYSDAAGTREVTILINSSTSDVYGSITAAGSEDVFGSDWAVGASAGNDLVYRDGLMTLTKSGVSLEAGTTYYFKLVANHDGTYATAWPASNYWLQVPEDGTYDITINFDITTETITVVPCLSTVQYYVLGSVNGGDWTTQATNVMTAGTDRAGNTIYYKAVTAAGDFQILVGCNGWSTGASPITRNFTHVNNTIAAADITLTEGDVNSNVSITATSGYIVYYPATNEICATTDLSALGVYYVSCAGNNPAGDYMDMTFTLDDEEQDTWSGSVHTTGTTAVFAATGKWGYYITNWYANSDYSSDEYTDDTDVALSDNNQTLTLTSIDEDKTVYAKLAKRWQIQYSLSEWSPTNSDFTAYNANAITGDSVTFTLDLAASTTYRFYIRDLLSDTYWGDNTSGNITSNSKNRNVQATTEDGNWSFWMTSGVTGRYYITFNLTTHKLCIYYPYAVNFDYVTGCSYIQGNIGAWNYSQESNITSGNGVGIGDNIAFWGYAYTDYELEGFYSDAAGNTQLADGSGNYYVNNVSADQTVYIKFEPAKLIIYRSGDKAGDARAISESAETYAGGTPSKPIEYRMKVHTLDQWYSLCLPFTVNAVKVWDDEDEAYYDLVPYYRSGGTFYTGHYIIRTPETATDFALADFGNWDDPTSPIGYLPSRNTPYIIQWHDSYFLNKIVSFFGASDQTIPSSMTVGSAPSADNVVNIYANDAMVSGSVTNGYTLDPEYGPGAWLRNDELNTARTVQPFECYMRASSTSTPRYAVIRRDMTIEDDATGWNDVINSMQHTQVTAYTLTGMLIGQWDNCSVNEAAQRLQSMQAEGIYLLHSDNETVKLIIGGK